MRIFNMLINGSHFEIPNEQHEQVIDQLNSVIAAGRGVIELTDNLDRPHRIYLSGTITVDITN